MKKLAIALTNYIMVKNVLKEEEREVYIYGFQIALESILCLIISVLIAIYLYMVPEGILFFVIFIPLRFYAGGVHLEHYLSCLILSSITYTGVLLIAKFVKIPIYISVICFIILIVAVWFVYPVKNKKCLMDKKEEIYFKKRLKDCLIIDAILFTIFLLFKNEKFLFIMVLTILLLVITMVAGRVKYTKNK